MAANWLFSIEIRDILVNIWENIEYIGVELSKEDKECSIDRKQVAIIESKTR